MTGVEGDLVCRYNKSALSAVVSLLIFPEECLQLRQVLALDVSPRRCRVWDMVILVGVKAVLFHYQPDLTIRSSFNARSDKTNFTWP